MCVCVCVTLCQVGRTPGIPVNQTGLQFVREIRHFPRQTDVYLCVSLSECVYLCICVVHMTYGAKAHLEILEPLCVYAFVL